jgi:hypothetical protein
LIEAIRRIGAAKRRRRRVPAQADLRSAQVKPRSGGRSHNPAILEQLAQSN